MGALHDYVLDPVPSVPIQVPGRATFVELFEVFADRRRVPLVGAADPEMGPYTRCIRVDAAEVDSFVRREYRRLDPAEEDAVTVTPDDFGDATD